MCRKLRLFSSVLEIRGSFQPSWLSTLKALTALLSSSCPTASICVILWKLLRSWSRRSGPDSQTRFNAGALFALAARHQSCSLVADSKRKEAEEEAKPGRSCFLGRKGALCSRRGGDPRPSRGSRRGKVATTGGKCLFFLPWRRLCTWNRSSALMTPHFTANEGEDDAPESRSI